MAAVAYLSKWGLPLDSTEDELHYIKQVKDLLTQTQKLSSQHEQNSPNNKNENELDVDVVQQQVGGA